MPPSSSTSPTSDSRVCSICGKDAICGGLGVISYDVPLGHPYFGRLFRCPNNPVEMDTERRERLRALSNLGAFADKTLDNFVIDENVLKPEHTVSLGHALRVTRRFAENPDGWLVLSGPYGCGKTHLAAAVGNARIERGEQVLFITAPDLLDHLRSTFGPHSEVAYDEMFERIRNAQLLILDDLGAENPSQWAQEKLFQLLNHRYSYHLPTVVTTNVDLDLLDQRIRSRLLDTTFVHLIGINAPDHRSPVRNIQREITDIGKYTHMQFESFDPRTGVARQDQDNLTLAYNAARHFAEQPQGWLVILGPFGCGKTHLAAAIANERMHRGGQAMFVTAADLVDYLRRTMNNNSPNQITFNERFSLIRDTPLLVLDDMSYDLSDFWKEKLFQILDHRYVSRLPTVITTSRPLEELDARLVTRLLDGRMCAIIAITAPDYGSRLNRGGTIWR